jgi:hypothetical protein
MNEKNQENEAPSDPLIFTVPACGFVVALATGMRASNGRLNTISASLRTPIALAFWRKRV